MIGSGTPSSQSNAPLPKSILYLPHCKEERRLQRLMVPSGDARHNHPRIDRILFARDRDAADVARPMQLARFIAVSDEVTYEDLGRAKHRRAARVPARPVSQSNYVAPRIFRYVALRVCVGAKQRTASVSPPLGWGRWLSPESWTSSSPAAASGRRAG
jgi:hypothetical protein